MTTLSFRPWANSSQAPEQGPLQDVLARVNVERGHFRDITEASLREEIASSNVLQLSDSDSDEDLDGDAEESDDADKLLQTLPSTREDLFKAKFEMLSHIQAANNDVMIALDYISLLQSKDAPVQAASTISPNLKSTVPLGSLGVDIWQRMPQDKRREEQDELLAVNVRMDALQGSADSLLRAAERLHDTVKRETQYWDRVLSITTKGWNVCRIPGLQQRLGVTFGFSESPAEFSRKGVAALTTTNDGSLVLEHSMGSKPQTLKVSVQRDGRVVGTSSTAFSAYESLDEGQSLEREIRQARDNLFDAELYREMIRESRNMASLGVRLGEGGIHLQLPCPSQSSLKIIFELSSPGNVEAARDQDSFASAVALAARLLLLQSHRDRLQKRTEVPPPLSNHKEDRPTAPILRPILAFLMHMAALDQVGTYFEHLSTILLAAQIPCQIDPAKFSLDTILDQVVSAQGLVSTFLQPWSSSAKLSIDHSPAQPLSMTVDISTSLSAGIGSSFVLVTPDGQQMSYVEMSSLQKSFDYLLAGGLAQMLSQTTDGRWKCLAREAGIFRIESHAKIDGREDEKKDGMRNVKRINVSLDSDERELSVRMKDETISWRVDDMSSEQSFWDVWRGKG